MRRPVPKLSARLIIKTLLCLCFLVPVYSIALKLQGRETLLAINLMTFSITFIGLYCLYRALLLLGGRNAPPPMPAALPRCDLSTSCTVVRDTLRDAGYRFHRTGRYGEYGTLRRVSRVVSLGSLSLLLLTGVYDNLRSFSGMLFLHTGDPKPLYEKETYQLYGKGPLASFSEIGYKLKGVEMYETDSRYPLGAMKMRLMTKDEKESWQFLLTSLGEGYRKDDLTFTLNSLEYDIQLSVLIDGNHIIYSDWLHLIPMQTPQGSFTHKGELKVNALDDVGGTALFDPGTDRLKLRLHHTKKQIDIELGRAPDDAKKFENYLVRMDGLARRGQVKVIRDRHLKMLAALAFGTVLSALVMACAPRRRVWLMQGAEGQSCSVGGDDSGLLARLAGKGV